MAKQLIDSRLSALSWDKETREAAAYLVRKFDREADSEYELVDQIMQLAAQARIRDAAEFA